VSQVGSENSQSRVHGTWQSNFKISIDVQPPVVANFIPIEQLTLLPIPSWFNRSGDIRLATPDSSDKFEWTSLRNVFY
jgi:hypothetical protein